MNCIMFEFVGDTTFSAFPNTGINTSSFDVVHTFFISQIQIIYFAHPIRLPLVIVGLSL